MVLMPRATFGTAINCIDGRVQLPVIDWMRQVLAVEYVDLITEPGPDGLLAHQPDRADQLVRPRVLLSLTRHASPVLAITAHHDCLANPVSEGEHGEQLRQAVGVLVAWNLGVKVLALWVNEHWQIEVVQTRSSRS